MDILPADCLFGVADALGAPEALVLRAVCGSWRDALASYVHFVADEDSGARGVAVGRHHSLFVVFGPHHHHHKAAATTTTTTMMTASPWRDLTLLVRRVDDGTPWRFLHTVAAAGGLSSLTVDGGPGAPPTPLRHPHWLRRLVEALGPRPLRPGLRSLDLRLDQRGTPPGRRRAAWVELVRYLDRLSDGPIPPRQLRSLALALDGVAGAVRPYCCPLLRRAVHLRRLRLGLTDVSCQWRRLPPVTTT